MPLEKEQKLHVEFAKRALKEFDEWDTSNPRIQIKILNLIDDIKKDIRLGKEEKLKYNNWYSRRITKKDRLVYSIENDVIWIIKCKGHYDDK